ncbi:MAG: glycosyltransferase family 4 protein [Chitinophagaceae bacterium]
MHIFLISNMYPSTKDQLFGIFVRNFKIEMEKQGVIFSKTALIHGRTVSALRKLAVYISHYSKAAIHFFSFQYDIIYLHYLSHHLPLLLMMVLFNRHPIVVNVHGSDIINIPQNGMRHFLSGIILRKIALLVVPTTYFRNLVAAKYPFIAFDKIIVSPSGGIDSRSFYKKKRQERHERIVIGFVSRFIEEKGWRTFLQAAVLLKKRGIPFQCLIAGKGPDEQSLKAFIMEHDLSASTHFLGFVPQEQLVEVYNQLDIYVFPTYRVAESLGLTGVEAMSCGVPVIGCNFAGPATYIEEGYNGYFFPPKEPEVLSEKICEFYSLSPEKKLELSRNALKTAASFDRTTIAKNLIQNLKKLIK